MRKAFERGLWEAISKGILVLWIISAVFIFLTVLLGALPIDQYAFRQTMVATAIREIIRDGPWLTYRIPVLGPPWSTPMEFPLFHILVAKISEFSGLDFVATARLVSLFSGAVTLALVWRRFTWSAAGFVFKR